ncbi:hypothetical protein INR49_002730 [Caranx melampygus]|nr:hypothetical protein INR49_002730 [Caranx melampygus]
MSGAARQSQRATELEKLLDDVRIKVQELEERYLGEVVQHGSRVQQLEQEKEAAKVCLQNTKRLLEERREALELKLSREKEKSAELQRKLYFAIKEEERQRERRSQTFQLLGERMRRHDPAADQE